MDQKKVLLVDDDPFLGKLYYDLLTAENYSVTSVTDGETALEKIKQGGWDLILLDMILPKLNGLDIIKKLGEQAPDKSKQKIIFLTNIGTDSTLAEITKTGYQYLSKSSLNPDQFVAKIKSYLQ